MIFVIDKECFNGINEISADYRDKAVVQTQDKGLS